MPHHCNAARSQSRRAPEIWTKIVRDVLYEEQLSLRSLVGPASSYGASDNHSLATTIAGRDSADANPVLRPPEVNHSRPRLPILGPIRSPPRRAGPSRLRSEEHTSELQSRLHLVCRLLLEKKKKRPEPTSGRPAQVLWDITQD